MSAPRIIYFNVDTFTICDSAGGVTSGIPRLTYREEPTYEIHFIRLVAGVATHVDVSTGTTWSCSVDTVFNSSSSPMARAETADIDDSLASTGIITVTISADTAQFLAKVGTSRYVTAFLCLKGYTVANRLEHLVLVEIYAQGVIDPSASPSPDVIDQYWTADQVKNWISSTLSGTQVLLTDDATTNIIVFDTTEASSARIYFDIKSATCTRSYSATINFYGTSATLSFFSDPELSSYVESGSAFPSGMSMAVDVSGTSVRLKITLASVGENLRIRYRTDRLDSIT